MSYSIREQGWIRNAWTVHIHDTTQTTATGENQHLKEVCQTGSRLPIDFEYVLETGFLANTNRQLPSIALVKINSHRTTPAFQVESKTDQKFFNDGALNNELGDSFPAGLRDSGDKSQIRQDVPPRD